MNLEESLQKLFSLHNFGIKLGLENIKDFLQQTGNPQASLKCFHVAGSNGKGSTSAFLASILQEMGFRTGLYTSPHFVRFNERIKVNSKEITDDFIAAFINRWDKYIDEKKLTFFEVTTAMAFQYFLDEKTDYAVIETGLGGRLDATNVINPLAAVITSISLEHTKILGETLSEIAAEKGGIIKQATKVFTGKLPADAENVIELKCTETKSQWFRIQDYINEEPGRVELYTEEIELDEWTMPLKGDYQKINAALAGLVIAKIFNADNFNLISAGIKNVIKNTGIQGRYEYFNHGPDIIFDSAHNPESVQNFLTEFDKEKTKYKRKSLLFSALNDKAVIQMLGMLRNYFSEVYITEMRIERALNRNELIKACESVGISPQFVENPVKLIGSFKDSDRDNCLVVLGSMYLLGEIKSAL